jgi:transposase
MRGKFPKNRVTSAFGIGRCSRSVAGCAALVVVAPGRRYPSDLTDRQWAMVEPLLLEPAPAAPGGRPPLHAKREIVNAILYLTRSGCAWRMLPRDFPPWRTVYGYFVQWRDDGTLDLIHDTLREELRKKTKRSGKPRDPEPRAGIVDSQSLRGADTVGKDTSGYDAGKKVSGRKRHIVTDTLGLLLVVTVTAASVQDRDGGLQALELAHGWFARLVHVFADGGYAGRLVEWARTRWKITVEIVSKPKDQRGFSVLPRRWVVERTFAWLMRWRRLVRDYERLPETHEAFVKWAMVGLMLNRLARPPGRRPWAPP